tara:strand:+ start:90 stop:1262 length:1173 start_codon:yes stop_codon:yes gene_type:complete
MNTFRRPMFRGGRVDSRGTGITSGLSYAKGGSVQARPGYFRGQLVKGLYQGAKNYGGQGINYLRNLLRGKPSTSKELVPPGYKFGDDFIGDFRRNLGVTGRFRDLPGVNTIANYISKNPKKSLAGAALFGLSDAPKAIFDYLSEEDTQRMLLPGVLERAILGDKEDEKKTTEELQDEVDNEAALQALLKELNQKEKKRLEADIPTEEDIEINKEKYAELLGKGAKGEDISNMLLSFAGKALAPEATVKSAFGEFAAEQAKTPSKKSKVDETAAALAINEYIAGKKSKAELDRFFAEMDYKKSLASRAGKENIAANIAEAGKSNSGYKAVELGLQITFPDAGRPIKIEKGQANDVPLTADNFGKIFIEDEAPYTAVRINIQDGVLFREPIY